MIRDPYETGKQPCNKFKPADDLFTGSGNVHECYQCETGRVSFCENCCTDHHTNGYETCARRDK